MIPPVSRAAGTRDGARMESVIAKKDNVNADSGHTTRSTVSDGIDFPLDPKRDVVSRIRTSVLSREFCRAQSVAGTDG